MHACPVSRLPPCHLQVSWCVIAWFIDIYKSPWNAGGARVKDCLEEHREDPGFSAECKEEFEAMMEARAADFRLDATLREVCADDIEAVCGYERDSLDTVEGFDARVIQCLQVSLNALGFFQPLDCINL